MGTDLKVQIAEEEEKARAESTNPDRTDLAHSYDYGQRRSALLDRLGEQLEQVERAIERIDEGIYGKCMNCGRDIAPSRLKAMPHAILDIQCQEELERRLYIR